MKIAVYSFVDWDSALAILRYRAAEPYTNLNFIQGSNKRMEYTLEPLAEADLVLLQRDFPVYLEAYQQVRERAHQRNLPVVYETDDLLFRLPGEHPDTNSNFYTLALLPMLQAIYEADAVTTSTSRLSEYLGQLHPEVHLLPNYLPDYFWPMQPPAGADGSQKQLVIGYLGSSSHEPDLQEIEPALEQILERYPQIQLKFWGCQPSSRLLERDRVHFTPLMLLDYQEYSHFCAGLDIDIAIAPLRDSPFNHSKSPIKFFEYSALGLPGVYADVSAYNQVVRDQETGLLAHNLQSWSAQLARMIESPALRIRLVEQAQQELRENWVMSAQASLWENTYQKIILSPRRLEPAQVSLPGELLFDLIGQITRHARNLQHQLADSRDRQEELHQQLERYRRNPLIRLLERLQNR